MKKSIKYAFGVLVLALCAFSLPVSAATIPPLGTAANFSALASTSMSYNGGMGLTFNYSYFGLSPAASSSMSGNWHPAEHGYFGDSPDPTVSAIAKADALTAYNNLAGQTTGKPWSGSGSTTPAAGVWYSDTATTTFNGTLTLSGGYNDVWVFQINKDFVFNGQVVMAGHAQPCHVFWQVGGMASTTIDNSGGGKFIGTLIAHDDIKASSPGLNIDGRIISLGGSLILDGIQTSWISGPTCACGLTLNKVVDNTGGGTAVTADWTLTATSATTSPTNLSGTTTVDSDVSFPNLWALFKADTYTLAETGAPANYTAGSWTCVGGTQTGSNITVTAGQGAVCTITNTYAPAIVPPCSSGCGGGGSIPPLIKVTKIASPQTLSAKGGIVTYTEQVSNPGLFALSDVSITDDKCAPVNYISGDTNGDSKLDPTETWIYTCRAKITKTTTNTVTVLGTANYLTAKDSAIATVIVNPKLPNTGLAPKPTFTRSLSIGMKGADVIALQTALEQKNLLTIPARVAKGYFGALTKTAVTKYQASVKLPTVGIFGPLTRVKLMANLGQ